MRCSSLHFRSNREWLTLMASAFSAPRRRILVIDDDPVIHDFVRHALRSEFLDIVSGETASEGLKLVADRSFDLILLDLGLPDVHGLEVMARLRHMGSGFRVIVITVDDTPESLLRAIRENAYEYLRKPFTANELADSVARALTGKYDPEIEVVSAKREWLE